MNIDANELYRGHFGFSSAMSPRPMQYRAVELARSVTTPGLMIIEAPMGEGKTEAALAVAEVFAERTGRGGVCVALPTMATTDAMFGRVHQWINRLPRGDGIDGRSVTLAHGKARLNEEFQGLARVGSLRHVNPMGQDLPDECARLSDDVVVSQWMQGRKRGMLANFVVCTIDQVLMGALEMKHLSLRHLALVNKVVIIDECHAYDAYMRCYLNRVLEWLGSMGVPVVLLSATLPIGQRLEMLRIYRSGWACPRIDQTGDAPRRPRRRFGGFSPSAVATAAQTAVEMAVTEVDEDSYPLISYTDGERDGFEAPGSSGRSQQVRLGLIADADEVLATFLETSLAFGGCAGVICTTVARAQQTARFLRKIWDNDTVVLTHARFIDLDRMANEKRLRELLGPKATRENGQRPERLVVVGTQVLEQSLDIDFDVLVSDVAPVDLVMQRLGRLHRHQRWRPGRLCTATCLLRGIDCWEDDGPVFARGVKNVYTQATLLEMLAVLGLVEEGSSCNLSLPSSIARAVRDAYGGLAVLPVAWQSRYELEKKKRDDEEGRKRVRANTCLLTSVGEMVHNRRSLVDWYTPRVLDGRDSDSGPRAVRDTNETVEVLALELRGGEVFLLPWIGDEEAGVEFGAQIDTCFVPGDSAARLAAQSAVRLPMEICKPDDLDKLIDDLEVACAPYVGAWQQSPWLAGCLVLLLERDEDGKLRTSVRGRKVLYSREEGLVVER